MDVTNLFRGCVKSFKTSQRKSDRKALNGNNYSLQRNKLLKLNEKLTQLIRSISKMKKYLLENRRSYINSHPILLSDVSNMTDLERDKLDDDFLQFSQMCSNIIKNHRSEVERWPTGFQDREHSLAVLTLISLYLRVTCDIHSEMRAVRVRRAVERQRMMRLTSIIKEERPITKEMFKDDRTSRTESTRLGAGKSGTANGPTQPSASQSRPANTLDYDEPKAEDFGITEDEARMLATENKQLVVKMNSLVDEVKEIEGRVVEIARLQSYFTDQVLEQGQSLDRLHMATIGSSENIKDGNELVRDAMRKNAGFRVFILFFIITLSFTILFLDWYNP